VRGFLRPCRTRCQTHRYRRDHQCFYFHSFTICPLRPPACTTAPPCCLPENLIPFCRSCERLWRPSGHATLLFTHYLFPRSSADAMGYFTTYRRVFSSSDQKTAPGARAPRHRLFESP
jgi:hypothetical protein